MSVDCKDCWEELETYYVMLDRFKAARLREKNWPGGFQRRSLSNEVDSRYVEIEREFRWKARDI
ncbi:MAG: hypothetical protein ACLRYY_08990 [Anaerobutyricum soehngenii]